MGIIISCDVDIKRYKELLKQTATVKGVDGYKIGFSLVFEVGMKKVVDITRDYTDKRIIYDHQKGGTDTPHTAKLFMQRCKGVDAVILFPFTGPATQHAWTIEAQDAGLDVIVGGSMTHQKFKERDGGYIDEESITRIYKNAIKENVKSFVIPGNDAREMQKLYNIIKQYLSNPIVYSPGIGAQGGSITEGKRIIENWYPIIGQSIYDAKNPKKAARDFVKELNS